MAEKTTSGTGWTCWKCGMFVPSEHAHYCCPDAWHDPPINFGGGQVQVLYDLQGLETKLGRIADALEDLVEVLYDIYGPPPREHKDGES